MTIEQIQDKIDDFESHLVNIKMLDKALQGKWAKKMTAEDFIELQLWMYRSTLSALDLHNKK